jgi:hypothetical protein
MNPIINQSEAYGDTFTFQYQIDLVETECNIFNRSILVPKVDLCGGRSVGIVRSRTKGHGVLVDICGAALRMRACSYT